MTSSFTDFYATLDQGGRAQFAEELRACLLITIDDKANPERGDKLPVSSSGNVELGGPDWPGHMLRPVRLGD